MPIKVIYPNSAKNSYTNDDSVDWTLTFAGEELVANTIVITGYLDVKEGNPAVPVTGDIKYSPMVGVHSFFDSWTTQLDNFGYIENIQSYPRMCKVELNATQDNLQSQAESDKTLELRCGDEKQTTEILKGLAGNKKIPFACRPHMCLNAMRGNLGFKKSGAVMVNFRLASLPDIFYGADADKASFEITDLQMMYSTVTGDGDAVVMEIKNVVRNNVLSSNHSLSTKVPIADCQTITGSFILSKNLSNFVTDNTAMEFPSLSHLEFQLNDNNGYLSYSLDDMEEILINYFRATGDSAKNDVRLSNLNEHFGIGLRLPYGYDFRQRKFGMNVHTGADNTVAGRYTSFLTFTGIIKV